MNLKSLIIEVTRRCNMCCSHCLRGDQENKDMIAEHVETLFSKISYVSQLTLTGGEPSLVTDVIKMVLEKAKEYNVGVGGFYVATNGKDISDKFVLTMMEWYLYCDENEYSGVALSNDQYHEDTNPTKLEALSFFSTRGEISQGGVISQGYGEGWNPRTPTDYGFEVDKGFDYDGNPNDVDVEGEVYLNVNGDIISGCDWSYENQEEHKVCHVKNLTPKALKDYDLPPAVDEKAIEDWFALYESVE